jgi:hypothetical protein
MGRISNAVLAWRAAQEECPIPESDACILWTAVRVNCMERRRATEEPEDYLAKAMARSHEDLLESLGFKFGRS